jgi:hypothetical protein
MMKMMKMNLSKGAVACLLALLVAPSAFAQTQWFAAHLDGEREVGNPGDADGWGLGVVGLGDGTVWYHLWVTDVAAPTAAHIHTGFAGTNGGIKIDFAASFTEVDSDTYVASGSVAIDAATIADVLDAPAGFYFNVHNSEFQAGAVRGQVIGDGPSMHALAGTLRGFRQVDNPGDSDGTGFGAVVFDDGMAHYFIATEDITEPTAAHIHSGSATQNGGIAVDFAAQFSGGVASGSAAADEDTAAAILANPDLYYFNVHNPDFPAGAVRGQLRATETVMSFAAISRVQGRAGSNFGTMVRVLNSMDEDVMVHAEWYPSNSAGLEAPDQTVTIGVGAASTAVIDDAVDTLFGADGNGGLRLMSSEPFVGGARIFNDQRDNPEIGGTFSQFIPSSVATGMPTSGALLLSSNQPASSGQGWRTNLGYFNPNPFAVTVTFNAWSTAGELLGSDTHTIEPYANQVPSVFNVIPSVPASERNRDDFTVTYSASAGMLIYVSVTDNVTNDPIFVFPMPVPAALTSPPAQENQAPSGTISSPSGNPTISEDESVVFEGMAEDPDGDDMTYLWDFGDGITSTALSPGAHTYTESGTYTVTFTVTDEHGLADPTPPTRTVTVEGGGGGGEATLTAVQNQIFTPSCASSGCHGNGSAQAGLSLDAGSAYGNIVNVASSEMPSMDRIEPGDPDNSYLWRKVNGGPGISGGQMPLGRPALSQDLLDLLRDWIEDGALDN